MSAAEIEQICLANNLQDPAAIERVKGDVRAYGNDLRRVKQSVNRELLQARRESVEG